MPSSKRASELLLPLLVMDRTAYDPDIGTAMQ
nr:MAG TPA: hypothetical protein [Caudoviricetes sp.]